MSELGLISMRVIFLGIAEPDFRHSRFTECQCVPYCLQFGTCTNFVLSLPGAELYPLEDMFITHDADLTSRRISWEKSQVSKG